MYNDKKFRISQTSLNGILEKSTIFHYFQEDNVLFCNYNGGEIQMGQLIGIVDPEGKINMRYHQIDHSGNLMTGSCVSIPEILESGKIRLHENWKWTSGDLSLGSSTLEEI